MSTMYDLVVCVVFMAIVVGLAAGILWVVDKCSLPQGVTPEERKAIVEKRTGRWQGLWWKFFVAMAAISLPLNAIGLLRKTEPIFPTVIWVVLAAMVLLGALNPYKGDDENNEE
jgi:hypothetical protein